MVFTKKDVIFMGYVSFREGTNVIILVVTVIEWRVSPKVPEASAFVK